MKKVKALSLLWIKTINNSWHCYSHINEARVLEGTFLDIEIGEKYKPDDATPETQMEAVRRLHSNDQVIETKGNKNGSYPEAKYAGINLMKSAIEKGRPNIWEARFGHEGERFYVGVFDCQDKAAMACNEYIIKNNLNKELYQI